MLDPPTEKLPARESRYVVQDDQPLIVTVKRQQVDESLEAHVANLSLGGAKLILNKPLNFTEEVQVALSLPDCQISFDVPARICWARPSGDEQWSVGCAFSERLTADLLNNLSGLGYLERRIHSRLDVDFAAYAKWELSDTNAPVQIRNYSTGGFVMISRQRAQADQQLMLEIPAGEQVLTLTARVVWQARLEDTYRIGCSFVGKRDAETMRQAAQFFHGDQDGDESTSVAPNRSRTLWYTLAGSAALIAWSLQWWSDDLAAFHPGSRSVSLTESYAPSNPGSKQPNTAPPTDNDNIPSTTFPISADAIPSADRADGGSTIPTASPPLERALEQSPKETAWQSDVVIPEVDNRESPPLSSPEFDAKVRSCIQMSASGQLREALTSLGDLVKKSPRDPAYRYVMAAIAHAAGFHDFAQVQLNLGWTLERRYRPANPLRLSEELTTEQADWLRQQHIHLQRSAPPTL